MEAKNLRHIASATEAALTQVDLAALAVQAIGQGRVSPSLQKDLADLMAVQDRLAERLRDLTRVPAGTF